MSGSIAIPNTFQNDSGNIALSLLDANFTTVANYLNDPSNRISAVQDSGAANAYVVNPTPAFSSYPASAYFIVWMIAANTNTATSTANINSLGALNIYQDTPAGPALLTGDEIIKNNVYGLLYDRALNSSAGGFHLINRPFGSLKFVGNTLAGDVALNNTINYFDGPSVAQAHTGKWFASGHVTVLDTAGAATFYVKLWDGTTVLASGVIQTGGASSPNTLTLSGQIDTPAGNLRISVRDTSSTNGAIKANFTGLTADSVLTVIRLG